MSSTSTIYTWSSRLLTASTEPGNRYGAHDAGEWQNILDKARAVEASAHDTSSDNLSVASSSEEGLFHPIERDTAVLAQGALLARTSSAVHADPACASFSSLSEGMAPSAPAQLSNLAVPLPVTPASGDATAEAEEVTLQASSHGKFTTTAAMPMQYARQVETASGMNVTWVTDDLGHVQLYLRAYQLSRHGALELAQRLRSPDGESNQAHPAVLVLNGIVLYDHRTETRQDVVFIG